MSIINLDLLSLKDNSERQLLAKTGRNLHDIFETAEFREMIMSFLSFQDLSSSLILVSKKIKLLITDESKSIFLKTFYIEYYGLQPPLNADMQELIKEAREEFDSILTNSNLAGNGIGGINATSALINNERCSVNKQGFSLSRRVYLDPKTMKIQKLRRIGDLMIFDRCLWDQTVILAENYQEYDWNEINKIQITFEKELWVAANSNINPCISSEENGKILRMIEDKEKRFNHRLNVLINNVVQNNINNIVKNNNLKDLREKIRNQVPFAISLKYLTDKSLLLPEESQDIEKELEIEYRKSGPYECWPEKYIAVCNYDKSIKYLNEGDYHFFLRGPTFLKLVHENILRRTAWVITEKLMNLQVESEKKEENGSCIIM